MSPAPTRRSHARLCPFRDHAALEFGHSTNHRKDHAARRRVRVDSVHDRLKRDIQPVEVFKDLQQMGLIGPTSCSIHVFGHDMAHERHQVLGRMNFESPYVDMPHRLTVRQNLRVFARLYGVTGIEEKIARLAEDLALVEFLDRASGSLSAGQKTRARISRRIAATATARSCSPRIIWRRSNACAIGWSC